MGAVVAILTPLHLGGLDHDQNGGPLKEAFNGPPS